MSAPPNLVYVGTYTRSGRSDGIYVFSLDPLSGRLALVSSVQEFDPSFLAFDPSRRFLFATCEGLTADDAFVASFAIDPSSGDLTRLSRQPSGGGEPCHLCVDPSGRYLVVANHANGTVGVFPINADGQLGPATDLRQHTGSGPGPTQEGPHTHHIIFDPPGQRLLVTDKGIDQVVLYQLDLRSGRLMPNDPPSGRIHAGAAPRHVVFGATGEFLYVNGEADMTLCACTYDQANGAMQEVQSLSTLPESAERQGVSTAEIATDPSGRFVYVSNRGHDSIACFAIDASTGRLTPLGHVSTQGRTPRNFAIDPSGRWLYAANQDSDTLVHFDIDPVSGALTPNGDVTKVGAPVCVLFS